MSAAVQRWAVAVERRFVATRRGLDARDAVLARYPRWLRWRKKVKREAWAAYLRVLADELNGYDA